MPREQTILGLRVRALGLAALGLSAALAFAGVVAAADVDPSSGVETSTGKNGDESTGADANTGASTPLSDASADKVLATAEIPDSTRKVGEVRLLARGNAVVVQTLLSTKLLSRVIAEIRKKEESNWPPDDASVVSYAAALDAARQTVEKRDPGAAWDDRRRRMLIEFAADSGNAVVIVGTFRFAKDGSDTTPHDREVFSALALPRAYVLRNMRLILADSFKVAEPDVDRLGPLGPAAAAAKPDASAPPGPEH